MRIGVQLPVGIPGVSGRRLLDWARLADDSPLSTLGAVDRLEYANVDPIVGLSAAAAVTERIELMACVLLASLRSAPVVAKEIASLSLLAPGRLTVGVAVGARPCDYELAGRPWEDRGRDLDAALTMLAGTREPAQSPQSLGPVPADLQILVGGASKPALRRMVDHGHGYIGGGVQPKFLGLEVAAVNAAWSASGRSGAPRTVAGTWVASDANWAATNAWRDEYLVKGGPPEFVRAPIARGRDDVLETIEAYRREGAEEMMLFPGVDDLDELEWIIDTVADLAAADGATADAVPARTKLT